MELNVEHRIPLISRWYFTTRAILFTTLLSLPFLLIGGRDLFWIVFVLISFIVIPLIIFILISNEFVKFTIKENSITVNQGILIKKSDSINFDRIQSVKNSRGLLDQAFGLSQLRIWTSSPEQIRLNNKKHKPDIGLLLNFNDAEKLKDLITNKK